MGDSAIQVLPYFHGLLPREDLEQLLKTSGDFLIRSTEPRPGQQRQYVLSVMIDSKRAGDGIKHLIFSPAEPGKYLLGTMNDTAPNIVQHYLKNAEAITTLNDMPVIIKTPIGRQKWELLHENIEVEKKLGAGAFGEVCMGKLRLANGTQTNVAIKVAKLETLTKLQIKEVMGEARIMRPFKHPHVVRFYGVAAGKEPLMIVMELVDKGALDDYLKKAPIQISPSKKMELCTQAAWGLEYLHHTLNPPIMHRDIAARNCLYGDEKVKISDFGLAKTGAFFQVTQMAKAPIRWLSPETLTNIIYTPKTDVFSYGVLCWEIFNDAKSEPYPGLTAAEFVPRVKEGYRMDFPDFTPPDFTAMIKTKVWAQNPNDRFTMAEIAHSLERMTSLSRPIISHAASADHQSPKLHDEHPNQQQHHQDATKKISGRSKVRKNNTSESDSKKQFARTKARKNKEHSSESVSNTSSRDNHRVQQQSRRQKGKSKDHRKSAKNNSKQKQKRTC